MPTLPGLVLYTLLSPLVAHSPSADALLASINSTAKVRDKIPARFVAIIISSVAIFIWVGSIFYRTNIDIFTIFSAIETKKRIAALYDPFFKNPLGYFVYHFRYLQMVNLLIGLILKTVCIPIAYLMAEIPST
jgi:hypothetical protein